MKITAIKQQVKRTDRFSIYIEGKYSFSLSESDLVSIGLRKDQELSAKELKSLLDESQKGKAYDRALRQLSVRPRSQFEITDYLKRKDYSEEVIATVLHKLQKLELIDDAKFARQWVEWRLNGAARSKRQLQAELIKKRVDREIIDQALTEVDDSVELDQIRQLIERKKRLSQYQDRQKLIAFLARRGFSYDLIKKALNDTNF